MKKSVKSLKIAESKTIWLRTYYSLEMSNGLILCLTLMNRFERNSDILENLQRKFRKVCQYDTERNRKE